MTRSPHDQSDALSLHLNLERFLDRDFVLLFRGARPREI